MSQQQQQDEERRLQEEERDKVNAYADAMIRRDKLTPKWLRGSLTGASDPDAWIYGGRTDSGGR